MTTPNRTVVCAALLVVSTFAALRADESTVPQQSPRTANPTTRAITGVNVVVSPGRAISNCTIVIRNGRITDVGQDAAVPEEAVTIALDGHSVYAGFIDAYSEQSLSSDRLNGTARYWNGQVTPQLSAADQIPDAGESDKHRREGFVARLIAPADGVIRGTSAVVSTGNGRPGQLLLARDVAQNLLLTLQRRSRDNGFPGSPMGAVALARQAILDAQWYRDARAAVAADPTLPAVELNDALQALQPVLNGSMPVMVSTSNEQFVLRAERFAAEFGLSLVVVGNGREYRRLEEIAALRRPMILPVAFPTPPEVTVPEAAIGVTLESLMHWDLAPENPARLAAAGVNFSFSTNRLDSPDQFLKGVRTAVERGLSPEVALRAMTTAPAALFGLSADLGTVEPGRLASLVITDGDLFDKDTKIKETWVAGERFEWSPAPARQPAGHYKLQLTQLAKSPQTAYLEISGEGDSLNGRISRAPIPSANGNPEGDTADKTPDQEYAPKPEAPIISLESVKLADTQLTAHFSGADWSQEGINRLSLTMAGKAPATADKPAAIGSLVWTDGTSAQVIATLSNPPAPPEAAAKTEEPADAADVADAETPAEAADSDAASFAVNYPLGAFGRSEIPAQSGMMAFVHATIWTCGPDGTLEDGTLLMNNGSIVAVGTDVVIPDGCDVVDVRGMHITPGIIDCHSHMATDGGVNEATDAITCEVRIGDFIDANDVTIYRQLAGGVTSSNILHGSANPIGGQNQVIKLRWGMTGEGLKFAEAPQGVKFALGENVKQSNWSSGGDRFPVSRRGVDQLFRESFEAARDYQSRMDAWARNRRGIPPRRDLELEALAEIVRQERWIHCHSYRQDEILALLRVLESFDITIGTLQHILEGYKVADELAKHGAMASAFSDWWAYKFEVYDAIPYAGALMHDQGVVVSFNSDDGELARHLNQEAAKAVKYGGVPREDALKFVTLNPARQLRVDHLVGSLETGKHADFVIWSGDPLSNFTRCEQTWIEGRRYFSRNEDEQMRATARERRNTLIQKILQSGEKSRSRGNRRDEDPADLWPRIDEYCAHFRHQAALQRKQDQKTEETESVRDSE